MKLDQVLTLSLAIFLGCVATAHAADWPNWLGPERDGTTSGEGFDPAFTQGGHEVAWSAELGVGFTGITIADGRAFTAGWDDGETTFFCFDTETGELNWSRSFTTDKYDNLNVGGPSGTAAVSDGRVYHKARDGRLVCYDVDDGDIVWQKDLAGLYDVDVPTWGFSGSPVIIGDVLYLDIGKVIALNKVDGREVWSTRDLGPAYSTPAPFTVDGEEYLAVFPRTGLHIVERRSGRVVAHHAWETEHGINAATPVIVDGDKIFISSDYNTGCAMLRFNDGALELLWENRKLKNQMCTSIFHEGYLFGFNSSKLTCIDTETGDDVWEQAGMGRGTCILAGENLIVLADNGEVIIAPASPEGFNPIGRARVIEGDDTIWTAPTLANGLLYIRGSRGRLVCIDARD
ncbi:PQQ-binding-like beta-propeller repeat protein [Phycisphaeraceae bacterium D3-23]